MVVISKRDYKIDLLLEKGMDLLWAKGYNATSVNDIVKAAKVPKGSFYFYFESKDDFVLKALDRYFNDMIAPAIKILHEEGKSPKERLFNFYDHRVTMLKEELECQRGCMACNLSSEVAEHNDLIWMKVQGFHKKVIEELVNVVEEAQKAGEISTKQSPRDLVEFVEDVGKGAMVSMKELRSAYPIDNAMNIIKTILLK